MIYSSSGVVENMEFLKQMQAAGGNETAINLSGQEVKIAIYVPRYPSTGKRSWTFCWFETVF